MTITRENYYDFPGVSNSLGGYILPHVGGSETKFHAAMNGKIRALRSDEVLFGHTVHKYLENHNTFEYRVINSTPSDTVREILNETVKLFPGEPIVRPTVQNAILETARRIGYGGKTWKDERILKAIINDDNTEYYANLVSGLPLFDVATESKFLGVRDAIMRKIPTFLDDAAWHEQNGPGWEIIREFAATWEYKGIDWKMLVDRVEINHDRKWIVFWDYKTTSVPISLYTHYDTKVFEEKSSVAMEERSKRVYGKMYDRHVHRQLRFYRWGFQTLFPGYNIEHFVLPIETNEPYDIEVYNMPMNMAVEGDYLVDEMTERIVKYEQKYAL
jgi:hypothetical protein